MDKKANWLWDDSSLEDMVSQEKFELAKQVVLGKADETTVRNLHEVVKGTIDAVRQKSAVGGWFYYNAEKKLIKVDMVSDIYEKEKIRDRLRIEGLKTRWKTVAANKEFINEVLSLVPDVSIKFDSTLAKKIQEVAQQKEDERLAQCSEDLRKKCAGYYKNFIGRMRMEDVIMVSEKNLTNNVEAKVTQEQKKSERMVMAPASKHIERMKTNESTEDVVGVKINDSGTDVEDMTEQETAENSEENVTQDESKCKVAKNKKEEMRAALVSQYPGTCFVSASEVRLTTNKDDIPHLVMNLKKDKKSGDRIYHLDEIVDGVAQCQNSIKADFKAAMLRKQGVALEEFVINRQGNYDGIINDILSVLQCIEQKRLLDVDSKSSINHEVLSVEDFMQRVQEFLLHNPLDERIAYIADLKIVGVVGRGNYTAYQNFKKLVTELAPENDVKRLKDNIFAKGFLDTDGNALCKDCQKTLSKITRDKYNVRGDKIYAFKFDDKFWNDFTTKYAEAEAEAKARKEQKQKE